ncbi:MAG: hypothetical protein U1F36_22590 [Planctomycetota bacterium]
MKDDIVMEPGPTSSLCREDIAEFDYRSACEVPFLQVALRKIITHERGQKLARLEHRNITNTRRDAAARGSPNADADERTIGELEVKGVEMLGDLGASDRYAGNCRDGSCWARQMAGLSTREAGRASRLRPGCSPLRS